MTVRTSLIASLAVAALALPVTSAGVFFASTDAAIAKSGKGGGNGGGNGGGKSASKSNGDAKSSNRGGAKSNRGNAKPQTRANKTTPASAPAKGGAAQKGPPQTAGMSPNQLGSMNGALHANINAVLAHIRNGNTNGPVGALAGLAMADHNAEGAKELIELADRYAETDIEGLLEAAELTSLSEYRDKRAAGEVDPIDELDALIADLEAAGLDDLPSADDLADARDALDAQMAAEDGIIAAWNKSDEATDEQKGDLLDALRARLDAEGEAVADTIDATIEASATDDSGGGGTLDPETAEMLDNLKF